MQHDFPRDPWLPRSPVVRVLILLNTLIWLLGRVGDFTGRYGISTLGLRNQFGLFPARVLEEGMFWTPFTYMFLHGNGTHLLVNMLGLYLLGPDLERAFRKGPFLLLYLISGVTGGIAYLGVSYLLFGVPHPCVGASGAITGLVGAIVAIYPRRIYVLLPLMIPFRATVLAVILLTSHIFFILTPFGGAVAYDVHLFGGLAGYALTLGLATAHRRHWSRKLEAFDPMSSGTEYEALLLRASRDGDPLSPEEHERLITLQQALRFEDVLTPDEAAAEI